MNAEIFEVEIIATQAELEAIGVDCDMSGTTQKAWDWKFDQTDETGFAAKVDNEYDAFFYWIILIKYLKKL